MGSVRQPYDMGAFGSGCMSRVRVRQWVPLAARALDSVSVNSRCIRPHDGGIVTQQGGI